MKTLAIIPARMGASRFPGKPMAEILGIPMIGHCYLRTKMSQGIYETYVATCDKEIFDYIVSIGGKAIMTADTHERATDRSAEALSILERNGEAVDVVIMVQGDEPLLVPSMLEGMIPPFAEDEAVQGVNLMSELKTDEEFCDPNEVKVVCDLRGRALYFSRESIPSRKKWSHEIPMYKQLGIIAFRRDYLLKFASMPQTPLEKIESVDMMRAIEHGDYIQMLMTDFETIGVDTPDELNRVVDIMRGDALLEQYASVAEMS